MVKEIASIARNIILILLVGFFIFLFFEKIGRADQMGIELVSGNYSSPQLSAPTGLGIIYDYKINSTLLLDSRATFTSYGFTGGYYVTSWYGTYYNQADFNYSQVDISSGPIYRPLNKRLSPVVGIVLDYGHRYAQANQQGYTYQVYGLPNDSFSAGPLVGLDLRLTKDMCLGLDLRYLVPAQGPQFYYESLSMKFSF